METVTVDRDIAGELVELILLHKTFATQNIVLQINRLHKHLKNKRTRLFLNVNNPLVFEVNSDIMIIS